MTYELIFLGHSYYSNIIFKLQKKSLKLLWGLEIEIHEGNILEN
jgi:hypothetical protein